MVAILTVALMTAAEISSLFSALGVIICFLCMVVFILRINGGDLFGTSVVHVAQPPVAQVSFQKVPVPFSLDLHKPSEAAFSDVQLKIQSDVSYVFRSYWGVMSDHLHSLMVGPWSGFYVDLIDSPQLNAEIINEAVRYDAAEAFELKSVGLNQSPSSLTLGSSPRKKYPLVVCLARQDSAEDADPSGVGALISIIHVKDSECQIPTCVLHQYLKQYSGQLTRLQALYTQGSSKNEETPDNENSSSDATDADTKVNNNAEEEEEEEEEEEDIPLDEACVVCQTKRITRALLPCRHVCVCSSCFGRLETCPMCRARFLAYFLVAPESDEPSDESQEYENEESRSVWRRMYDALNNMVALEQ